MHAIWYFLDYKTNRPTEDKKKRDHNNNNSNNTLQWMEYRICLCVCMYLRKTVQLKSGKRSLYIGANMQFILSLFPNQQLSQSV